MKILKLFRPQNLLLLAFTMFVFRYGFLEQQLGLLLALNHWQYALLVLACVLIAAGGALMDTISGTGKDSDIVSETQGYNIYYVLNLTAIAIGYYLADLIGKWSFVAVFVIAASMLYFAANSFRQTILVGNIFTALCVWASIVIIGVFNFYPFLAVLDIKEYFNTMFGLLRDYALFALVLTLLYTLVKDLQSIDADYNNDKETLPIAIGRDRAAKVAAFVALVVLAMLLYYCNTYLISLLYAMIFLLAFVAGPLIYVLIKLWTSTSAKDFALLARIVQIVMVMTVISVMVITYNVNHHA